MGRHSFFLKLCDAPGADRMCVCTGGRCVLLSDEQLRASAKQTELRTTVKSIAEQTELLRGSTSEEFEQFYILSIRARCARRTPSPCWSRMRTVSSRWPPRRMERPTPCQAI